MLDTMRPSELHGQIGFFCECDEPTCYRVAWLSGRQYAALQAVSSKPLAPFHDQFGWGRR
jgi:hypothetical protein